MVDQPTCMGCCLHPEFYYKYNVWPKYPPWNTFENAFWQTPKVQPSITSEEMAILSKLAEVWTDFTKLEKSSVHDQKEFLDSIHRAQQIIALRVARRVNPDVWNQPE